MRPSLNIKQTGLLLVLLPVVFGMVFILVPSLYLAEEAKRFQSFQETRRFVRTLIGAHATYSRLLFVYFFSPRDSAIKSSEVAKIEREIRKTLHQESTSKNLSPELEDFVKDSRSIGSTTEAILDQMKESMNKPHNSRNYYQMSMTVMPLAADMDSFQERLVDLYTRLDSEEPARLRSRIELLLFVAFGILAGAAISFAAVWFLTRNIVERLNRTADRARLIAFDQCVAPPEQMSDEIGQLEQQIYDASIKVAETHKRESAVLNGASHLICTLDARLRITVIGDACLKLWGYATDELLGKSILAVVDQDSRNEIRGAFERLKSEEDADTEMEVRVCMRDGSRLDTVWSANWSAKNRSYYCVVRDVTELRRIEKLRQYFLSMAGHDLRSPLTAIGVNFNLISEGARGPVSEQLAGEINQMERTLQRMIDFVNQLLDLEKLEANRGQLNLGAISASDVCESARESLEHLCEQRRVKIGEPKGAALVRGDEILVEKAITNLLSSAVKLAPPDCELPVGVNVESGLVLIRVTVPGIAITSDISERMFDKLRLSSPIGKDIGLGLAFVKAVADLHCGEVGIESRGDRSTIWLGLPFFDGRERSS